MQPITFECQHLIPATGAVICAQIAETARWSDFQGDGLLPGIVQANYETRAPNMVGSRIRVQNTDGSRHVEEIYAWEPGVAVGMKLCEFTPPLKHLASHFTEDWRFEAQGHHTLVTRTLRLYPRAAFTRPAVWLIAVLFRRAIARHLAEMARAAARPAPL
jgi:hypothetical protein